MTVTRQKAARRVGFTLLELILAMSAVAIIGSLSVMTLNAMMRQQRSTVRQLAIGTSLTRVGTRFRADVNNATGVTAEETKLTLTLPSDEKITWSGQGHWLVRTVESNGEQRQDRFELMAGQTVSFAARKIGSIEMLEISVSKQLGAADNGSASESDTSGQDPRYIAVSRGSRVMAQLARDHRWEAGNDD